MSTTINIILPSMSAEEALSVFPEIDIANPAVSLTSSEGTIQLQQKEADWASKVQIQVDDDDALDAANTDDIIYKLSGSWPAYDDTNLNTTFNTAVFDGSGHTTLKLVQGDETVTTLAHALRADMSEDMTGSTEAFDIFSNESDLDSDFVTAANVLEAAVSSNWATLVGADTESLGAGVLSNATPAGSNPGRHILQQILNNNSHPSNAEIVANLAARTVNSEYINVPLKAGDKIYFNITFLAPTSGGGQALPQGGLSSGAVGAQTHVFKVEVTLI